MKQMPPTVVGPRLRVNTAENIEEVGQHLRENIRRFKKYFKENG
jgi:hypothetical protein